MTLPSHASIFTGVYAGIAYDDNAVGTMKLIVSTGGKHELYVLSTDPAESHGLRSLENAAGLETSLRQWIGQIPGRGSSKPAYDDAEIRRLKSLGYLQ